MIQRSTLLAALALVCATAARADVVVYNQPSAVAFGSYALYSQFGDSITLGGTERLLTNAQVQITNNANTTGTFDSTLYFYQVGAPVGSLIGSFTRTVSIGAFDRPNVDFTNLNLVVPNDLVVTVGVSNVSSGLLLGLVFGAPAPTVGASDSNSFIEKLGPNFLVDTTGYDNMYLQLTASSVPEPSTISMAGGAALLLLFAARRRKR